MGVHFAHLPFFETEDNYKLLGMHFSWYVWYHWYGYSHNISWVIEGYLKTLDSLCCFWYTAVPIIPGIAFL